MFNTIILQKGTETLTKREYKGFQKGDTIYGLNQEPEELRRWNIEDEKAALEELNKYRCEYRQLRELFDITEYALMYCECDENGEFIQGADYDIAEEAEA